MGVWKIFCEQTHMHGFYEMYDSNSKTCKAIWLAVVGFAVLITCILVFNAADDFVKQPMRIMIERDKPDLIPYPPMKFCFMHWLAWVDWRKVEELQFSKSELFYALSYLSENIYASEYFNASEAEDSVKNKLNARNMTLKQFFKTIAKTKNLLRYPNISSNNADLTVLRIPHYRDIFDLHHLMCYTIDENYVQQFIEEQKNNNSTQTLPVESMDKGYKFVINVRSPFYDDHGLYVTDYEYNMLIQDFKKEWHLETNHDYKNRIPIMFYPNGHSSSFMMLLRSYSAVAVEVSMSAYINKHSKDAAGSCKYKEKSFTNTNFTSAEDCFKRSRVKILRQNNAEETWLGFADSISPKKIHFLDKSGYVIKNSTYIRRHKLENLYYRTEMRQNIRNKTHQIINYCSDKSQSGCEVWDIQFRSVDAVPNGRGLVFVYYPEPDQIPMMKEVNVQTLWNFIGEVGGVLGIWTGASVLTLFQIFHLCFRCYSETE